MNGWPGTAHASLSAAEGPSPVWLRALIAFLVLEYVRPPLIVNLRLQMVIAASMSVLWLTADSHPRSRILTAHILFFLVCLAAIPTSENSYAAYTAARTMFGHVSIALGLSWLLSYRPAFSRVTGAWLLIMTYAALYGLLNAGHGPGAQLGDENDLALGLATAFPFAFLGFDYCSGRRRWLFAVLAILFVGGIVASFSRGGFVGLMAGAMYCLVVSRHRLRTMGIALAAAIALLAFAPTGYIDEIYTIQDTESGTAKGRKFLWTTAVNMWADHPILGVGGGNFRFLAGRYQPVDYDEPQYIDRDWSGTVVHSIYFETLSEQGIVGILLLGFIIGAHFHMLRRLLRDVAARRDLAPDLRRDTGMYSHALIAAVVAFAVAGAFLSVTCYPYLWYFTGMAVGLDAAIRRELAPVDVRGAAPQPGGLGIAASAPRRPRGIASPGQSQPAES